MVGDLETTFAVGDGQISALNGMAFENVHLSANQPYVFFISSLVTYTKLLWCSCVVREMLWLAQRDTTEKSGNIMLLG